MEDEKATLLIVEDDLDIADMLNAYFRIQGYEVLTVNWGEDGVRAAQTNHPDLVILDIRLPDIDGFEVARRLRSNRRTQNLPILFLTEKRERQDRLAGLQLNADDYITKPFDIQELRLRVRNALARARRGSLTNPITGLPEGTLVRERLEACQEKPGKGILVVVLQNVTPFREAYGFVASDDLLRAVAIMLQDALREHGGEEDFLGQVGADAFLILTQAGGASRLKESIRKRLEQSFDYFYRDQDRAAAQSHAKRLAVLLHELSVGQPDAGGVERLKLEIERLAQSGAH